MPCHAMPLQKTDICHRPSFAKKKVSHFRQNSIAICLNAILFSFPLLRIILIKQSEQASRLIPARSQSNVSSARSRGSSPRIQVVLDCPKDHQAAQHRLLPSRHLSPRRLQWPHLSRPGYQQPSRRRSSRSCRLLVLLQAPPPQAAVHSKDRWKSDERACSCEDQFQLC